jgi:hypothetical protein
MEMLLVYVSIFGNRRSLDILLVTTYIMTREELDYMLREALVAKLNEGKTSEDDRVDGILDAMVAAYNKALEDVEDACFAADQGFGPVDINSLKIK